MFIRLLLLFTLVPLVELALLIKVGTYIGVTRTLLIVILTGVAGAALARSQGFRVLQKARAEMESGRLPAEELFDGIFILAGGLLLLTPGLLTDALGFLALIPPSRDLFKRRLRKKAREMLDRGEIHTFSDY